MAMNAAIKADWTAALRSGDYPQAMGILTELKTDEETGEILRDADGNGIVKGHCCLGVLSELGVKAGIIGFTDGISESGTACRFYDGVTGLLPAPVAEWAGLDPDVLEPSYEAGGAKSYDVRYRTSTEPVNCYFTDDDHEHTHSADCYETDTLSADNDAEVPFTSIATTIDQHL